MVKWQLTFYQIQYKDAEVVALRTYKDKKGKYGRILGEIICDGVNMNQVMVETRILQSHTLDNQKKRLQNNTCKTENSLTTKTLFGHNE